jgi:hypothetical protein
MVEFSKPRLLIISNNYLSLSNSNGRTLFNLIAAFPNEKIANFCVRGEMCDIDKFTNFFRVTDEEAYHAWKTRKPTERLINTKKIPSSVTQSTNINNRKNPLFSLVRDFIWNSGAWKSSYFNKWLDEFNPQVILLQAGDAPFLFRLACRIAKQHRIPLLIYNSEDYCFKKYNYMSRRFGAFYPFFHYKLFRQVKKAIKVTHTCIYNSEALKSEYEKHFKHNAEVIMNSSSLKIDEVTHNSKKKKLIRTVYLGNLGVGRHYSLIEIAKVLHQRNLTLDVYGPGSQDVINELSITPGVTYHGVVDYQKVQEIITASDLIVHAEPFGKYAVKDLKFAFSTKIADSLASGIPFFLYAPKELACSTYLSPLLPDFVAFNHKDMVKKINHFLDGITTYPWYNTILPIVRKNHSYENNQRRFISIINDIIQKNKE